MALARFTPTLWAGTLLVALRKSLVYGQPNVANREYEGEIRQKGDSVKILSIGDITVKNYTRNSDIDAPQALTDADQMLNITEEKYFNFAIDDVDAAQASVTVMQEAMSRSGYKLNDVADQFIAAKYTEVPSANLIGDDTTPIVPTSTTAYEYLVDLGVKLDEADIPSEGRFAVVPPWFHGLLLKDQRFVSFGTESNKQTLLNGMIGQAAGFNVLKSNNVPNTSATKYKIIAGHPMALSYAEQVAKVEAYRPEKRFSDAVKGLHIYGGKLVRPYAWAVLTANKS